MKIVVDHTGGSRAGQRQVLEATDRLVFGRHPKSDVTFDAHRDLDASSRHAELVYEQGRYVLRDIGSSNGTLVKGEPITEVSVPPGVPLEIEFGSSGPRVRLFIGSAEAAPPVPKAGQAPVKRGTSGPRTLSAIWRIACAQADERRGLRRARAIASSVLEQAIHRSTVRFKVGAAAIAALLTGAVVIALLADVRDRDRAREALARESAVLAQRERDNAIRMDRAARMRQERPGAGIASSFGDAVYLLVVEPPGQEVTGQRAGDRGGARGFCAAFAVAPRHLATSARCVLEAERLRGNGFAVYALGSADTGPIELGAMFIHPDYAGGVSTDVGLVESRAGLAGPVAVASAEQLAELGEGANVFALGFDGRVGDGIAPDQPGEAVLVEGVVGALTDLAGRRGTFDTRLLIQHNLPAGMGTPGSPVFDGRGRAVAVNGGSYGESSVDGRVEPETGENKTERRSILTPGASYALRIDALVQLMRDNGVDLAAVGEGR